MTNILYVTSSPRGAASFSNQTAQRLIDELNRANTGTTVTVRDLAREPLAHIDQDFVDATRSAVAPANDRQRAILARSDELVDELLAADIVVIAAGMVNFSVPSTLKAWIDYVARAGRTFSYGAGGPKGLATGKRVVIVAATGGIYSGPLSGFDFQLPWLKAVLGFLGMTDVEVVQVEGTALGPQAADAAMSKGAVRAAELATTLAL
jgi:FMN-dependent NADH-azoreductase